jgi:glutamine synthetase
LDIIKKLAEHINFIKTNTDLMVDERKKANGIDDARERAIAYDEKVKAYFDPIRYHVDKLEQLVDDAVWPLPKFRELMFLK